MRECCGPMIGSVSTWVPVRASLLRTSAVRSEAEVAAGAGSDSTRQLRDFTMARMVAGVCVVVLTLGQGWAAAMVHSSSRDRAILGDVMVPSCWLRIEPDS